jgi:hypothetical protein
MNAGSYGMVKGAKRVAHVGHWTVGEMCCVESRCGGYCA